MSRIYDPSRRRRAPAGTGRKGANEEASSGGITSKSARVQMPREADAPLAGGIPPGASNRAVNRLIQRRSAHAGGASALPASNGKRTAEQHFEAATRGSAEAVPYRAEMERAFGADFSSVAAYRGRGEALAGIQAAAATRGEAIAFADAMPDRETVAHELVHVVRNRDGETPGHAGGLSDPKGPAEREADSAARRVAGGGEAALSNPRGASAATPSSGVVFRKLDAKVIESVKSFFTTANSAYETLCGVVDDEDYREAIGKLGAEWFVKMIGRLSDAKKTDGRYGRMLGLLPLDARRACLPHMLPVDATPVKEPAIWKILVDTLDGISAEAASTAVAGLSKVAVERIAESKPMTMRLVLRKCERDEGFLARLAEGNAPGLFAMRFGVKAVKGEDDKVYSSVGAEWNRQGIARMWSLMRELPDEHTTARPPELPRIVQVARLEQGDAHYYSDARKEVAMVYGTNDALESQHFAKSVYHEVGHAVDYRMRASETVFDHTGPCWKSYERPSQAFADIFADTGGLPKLRDMSIGPHIFEILEKVIVSNVTAQELEQRFVKESAKLQKETDDTAALMSDVWTQMLDAAKDAKGEVDHTQLKLLAAQLHVPRLDDKDAKQIKELIDAEAKRYMMRDPSMGHEAALHTHGLNTLELQRLFTSHGMTAIVEGLRTEPWKNVPTPVGGRVYHESYAKGTPRQWSRYQVSARAHKVSDYQFRAPSEWFAEAYASFYGAKEIGSLKAVDPETFSWFEDNVEKDRQQKTQGRLDDERKRAQGE